VNFSQTQIQEDIYWSVPVRDIELSFAVLAELFGEDILKLYNKLRAYLPKTASGGVHGKF
jgi:hypothetical protein